MGKVCETTGLAMSLAHEIAAWCASEAICHEDD